MTSENLGLSHLVLYQTNPSNASAVKQIIEQAKRHLQHIPGVTYFHVGPKMDNKRAVGSGFEYDVALSLHFEDKEGLNAYMSHPDHLEFVRFVLNGRMLKGTDKKSVVTRKNEFIDHILHASPEEAREWVIDTEVPNSERVWQDEQVYDFGA
jgi:hypothetical protein